MVPVLRSNTYRFQTLAKNFKLRGTIPFPVAICRWYGTLSPLSSSNYSRGLQDCGLSDCILEHINVTVYRHQCYPINLSTTSISTITRTYTHRMRAPLCGPHPHTEMLRTGFQNSVFSPKFSIRSCRQK